MKTVEHKYDWDELIKRDLKQVPDMHLQGFYTQEVREAPGGGYIAILANIIDDTFPRECPFCGKHNTLVKSGRTKPRIVHDVSRGLRRVDIIFQPVRLECTNPDCAQRFVYTPDSINMDHAMTQRLVDYLKVESFVQPHTSLAARCGVSNDTVCKVMEEQINVYEEQRRNEGTLAPCALGIDEKHLNGKMRGIIVDIDNGYLLDVMETNDEEAMKAAIKQLQGWETEIGIVTTDMNNSYLKWLPGLLPKAKIIIDKFHVIQDVEQRISKTTNILYDARKSLIDKIEDPEEKARQRAILRIVNDNKRLFNYSSESLAREYGSSKPQKLATVMNEFPEFRILRMLYSGIENVYLQETKEDAEKAWQEWEKLLPPANQKEYELWCDLYSVLPPMFDAFRSFSRPGFQYFEPFILNYFEPGCRFTNAAAEGLNNLIGGINRTGNGYSFKILRAKAMFASTVYERHKYFLNVKSIQSWKPQQGAIYNMTGTITHIGNIDEDQELYEYDFIDETYSHMIPFINVFEDNSEALSVF